MWRVFRQRLGWGYLLMLPTMVLLGSAVQGCLEIFFMEIEASHRDMKGIDRMELHVLKFVVQHATVTPLLYLLLWWIGAWALLRRLDEPTPLQHWRVMLAVNAGMLFFTVFLAWCCVSLARSLYLFQFARPMSFGFGITMVLLAFVTLSVLAARRLRSIKTPVNE